MKLKVTEQDKRLLSILSALAMATAFLILGIIPLHRKNQDMNAMVEAIAADVEEKQKKLVTLAQVKSVEEENRNRLERIQESLYPMLESQEIDRILTEMALAYGLSVRKMEIQMPNGPSSLPAFKEEKTPASMGLEIGTDSVYQALVLLEIIGSKEGKAGFLDAIAREDIRIRTLTMRRLRMAVRGGAEEEEGELEVLELRLEVSMCRKEKENGDTYR